MAGLLWSSMVLMNFYIADKGSHRVRVTHCQCFSMLLVPCPLLCPWGILLCGLRYGALMMPPPVADSVTSIVGLTYVSLHDGPGFEYFPNPSESSLIVDSSSWHVAECLFSPLGVRIVCDGRFLGGTSGQRFLHTTLDFTAIATFPCCYYVFHLLAQDEICNSSREVVYSGQKEPNWWWTDCKQLKKQETMCSGWRV